MLKIKAFAALLSVAGLGPIPHGELDIPITTATGPSSVKLVEGPDYICINTNCEYTIKNGAPSELFGRLRLAIRGQFDELKTSCSISLNDHRNKILFSCQDPSELKTVISYCAQFDQLSDWHEVPLVTVDVELITFTEEGFENIRNDLNSSLGNQLADVGGKVERVGFDVIDGVSTFRALVGNKTKSFIQSLISREVENRRATRKEAVTDRMETSDSMDFSNSTTNFRDSSIGTDKIETGFNIHGVSEIHQDRKRILLEDFSVSYSPRTEESYGSQVAGTKEPRSIANKISFKVPRLTCLDQQTYLVVGQTSSLDFRDVTKPKVPLPGKITNALFGKTNSQSSERIFLIFFRPRIADTASMEAGLASDAINVDTDLFYTPQQLEKLSQVEGMSLEKFLSGIKIFVPETGGINSHSIPLALQFNPAFSDSRLVGLRMDVELLRAHVLNHKKVTRRAGAMILHPLAYLLDNKEMMEKNEVVFQLRISLSPHQDPVWLNRAQSLMNGIVGMQYNVVFTPTDANNVVIESAKPISGSLKAK